MRITKHILAVAIVLIARGAVAVDIAPASQPASEIQFIAFGDWGLVAPERQMVANGMADYASKATKKVDAALVLGDNFYVPLYGADDPNFKNLFEDTYDARLLNFPFYALLGNHDYSIDKGHVRYEWEMRYSRDHPDGRWKLPARWYRIDLPAKNPLVTVLMLDSDKEVGMTVPEWAAQDKWLADELASPRAAWTICCSHHTIYSNGGAGDNGVLANDWGKLFEKYKVDFHLCGHDHSLQHLEPGGLFTSFIVSGGGGAARRGMLRDDRGPFSRAAIGFATLDIQPDKATVQILDGKATVLHSFIRQKSGQMKITKNSPSETRVTDPLKLIQGFFVPPTTMPDSTQPDVP